MSRVLLVGKGAPDRGGIPSVLDDLRGGELARLHQVSFLNVAHDGTPQGGRMTARNALRTCRDAVLVWRRSAGHDVVHLHSALAPSVTVLRAGLLALAARARGCGVVVHAHGGNLESWLLARRARLLLRLSMLPAQSVVAVWSQGRHALAGVLGAERVRFVGNGVDPSRYREPEPPHEPPRVLYVGLLTARKGVLDLIEASRTLRARGVGHELWLLGGTPDEGPEAAEAVRTEAADGGAILLGTRRPDEMPATYAAADVVCLPSWWEAMPMSVLEAMAAGLPVVATTVGDVPRLVEHGTTGRLVRPRSPEQLVDALATLLADPALRRRMGQAARRRVERHFSSTDAARAISEVYADVRRGRR